MWHHHTHYQEGNKAKKELTCAYQEVRFSFFGKFGMVCFLVTSVLRFADELQLLEDFLPDISVSRTLTGTESRVLGNVGTFFKVYQIY